MSNFKQNGIKVVDYSPDVDAEHDEEKQDEHSQVYRHIHRQVSYRLLRNADFYKFSSTFLYNGKLTIWSLDSKDAI